MKRSEIAFGLARIPVDFAMAISASLIAYRLRTFPNLIPGLKLDLDLAQFQPLPEYLKFSIAAAIGLVVLFGFNKMYTLKTTYRITKEVRRVFMLNSAWLMFIIAYFFVMREFPFSRLVLVYTWVLSIILIAFGRILTKIVQREFLKIGIGQRRVLFIGNNTLTRDLFKKLRKNPIYKCIGVIDNNLRKEIAGLKPLGKINELTKILKRYKIDEIIQTKSEVSEKEILDSCQENHVGYSFVPDLLEVHRTNVSVEMQAGIPLITLRPTPLEGWGRIIKRGCDL
ncbi:MAG: hypothetical protein ABH856_00970, partial [Patescibacteria group bacterium]